MSTTPTLEPIETGRVYPRRALAPSQTRPQTLYEARSFNKGDARDQRKPSRHARASDSPGQYQAQSVLPLHPTDDNGRRLSVASTTSSASSSVVIYNLRSQRRDALRSRSLNNVRQQASRSLHFSTDSLDSMVAKPRTMPPTPIRPPHNTRPPLSRKSSDLESFPWAPMLDIPGAIPPAHSIGFDLGSAHKIRHRMPRRAFSAEALSTSFNAPALHPFKHAVKSRATPAITSLAPTPPTLPPGARHFGHDLNSDARKEISDERKARTRRAERDADPPWPVIDDVRREEEDRWRKRPPPIVKSRTVSSSHWQVVERGNPETEPEVSASPYPTYGEEERVSVCYAELMSDSSLLTRALSLFKTDTEEAYKVYAVYSEIAPPIRRRAS
jgi:hypothetical protein